MTGNVREAPNVTTPFVCVNVGVVIVPPLKTNTLVAADTTKLVLALIVPVVIVNVLDAVTVQVVQDITPMLLNVPAKNDAAPEHVKLNEAKLIVPDVIV